jgi:hypothetical protein
MEVENISKDFVLVLHRGRRGNDAIWVIVDLLTKFVLFFSMEMMDPVNKLAKLYVNEIVRLHRVLMSIVLERNPKFTSRLWSSAQYAIGTKLNLSITLHPRLMDNLTEQFKYC